jgi:superfamily II DNA or RNA helicase
MAKAADVIGPFEKKAKSYLARGQVKDIEFSGGTYQVQVVDEGDGEEYWPFIQFAQAQEIRDHLCSCDMSDEQHRCVHVAAAVLRIYNGHADPLHLRFQASLWNRLCQMCGSGLNFEHSSLRKIESGHYVCDSVTRKQIFSVQGHSEAAKKQLRALIERRVPAAEETSLKFSGLPQEEIILWREGRPSQGLRYELSVWADLARWLMLLQEDKKKYELKFEYSPQGLPNGIAIRWAELTLTFYLSEANLPEMIPSLSTVESPLKVYHFQDAAIDKVLYDPLSGELHIYPAEGWGSPVEMKAKMPGEDSTRIYELDEWIFVPGDGFYSKEQHTLLMTPHVPPERLGEVLRAHAKTIAKHLIGHQIHSTPIKVSYQITFDADWNLHLSCYLFNPGDLHTFYSRYYKDWAYLEDDGFYPLEEALFDHAEEVIPEAEVSAFVHRHRYWLNTQEKFHTHLSTVESSLKYRLEEDDTLVFESSVDLSEDLLKTKDFGDWIYVADQGFYLKEGRGEGAIQGGTVVTREEIPLFLRMNREELELVPEFFIEDNPVVGSTLNVSLNAKRQIVITPQYELAKRFRRAQGRTQVRYFAEFVYVQKKGFAEIAPHIRLPERFRAPLVLKGQELELFLAYELEALKPYISWLDPQLQRAQISSLMVSKIEAESRGMLSLKLDYQTEQGMIPALELARAIKQGERHLFGEAGMLDLNDPRFQWLRQLAPARLEHDSIIRMTPLELMRLNAIEILKSTPDESVMAVLQSFTALQPPQPPNLSGLNSQLRHYQEAGVAWLWFLYSHALSGLLCDDMGLGKTHQAMALLAAVSNAFQRSPPEEQPQYLVVCPTSVIYHWKEKLRSYLPGLKVHVFYGAQRSLDDQRDFDVLVTSYGVLRSEKEVLGQISFEVAIFDEIQIAKNHNSQTYASLTLMQARMRLGLTGTPIENNLRELKALFDVVLPSYLPSEASFRDHFMIPIEKNRDVERRELLKRIINPFVLRRKKDEVLTELPEKTEEKSYCELSPQQRQMYQDVLNRSREQLIEELQDTQKPVAYMHIFAMLSTLKQICDHPAVYLKSSQDYKNYESGKWELFVELIGQARESSQKVVVFSQYLDMLDIIEQYLTESGIGFAAIRGKTLKREEELKRFAEDPRCEVFVGSLQAAGLGIDLTAASIVIHYDRWWNAARENQATDRVHRLGQTRGVQVFKLLMMNTIEERIDVLIEKKGSLMEEVIGTDDHTQLKAFSREDLLAILRAE